ncbi:MAG: hypothetical protein F6K04_08995 [Leptolyngbya sp. SIO4C5]|nr:hypothetical protein [Leptolyngbya sp. SIO4C5]
MRQRILWLAGLVLCALVGVFFVSGDWATSPRVFFSSEAAVAQEQTEPATSTFSGSYEEPQGRFQIGILSGFSVSPIAGSVLLEAPDGSLAYSVTVVPAGTAGEVPTLTNAALAQIVRNTFASGEGFQPTGFQALESGGVQIPWVGRLTLGTDTQPVQGVVLARQNEAEVYLLAIAAVDDTDPQSILPVIADSLAVL